MKERADSSVAFFHMAGLAALSVAVLVGIGLWQGWQVIGKGNYVSATNPSAPLPERAATPWENFNWQAPLETTFLTGQAPSGGTSSSDRDGLSNIEGNVVEALLGSYAALAEAGLYAPEDGEKLAEDIGTALRANVSYPIYSAADLKTDADTSYDRMLEYRASLRVALEPLLENPGYELGLFATYIESRDPTYMDKLRRAAENYRAAVGSAADVVVPKDAVAYHLGILNALSQFGATVEAMAEHADDAFAAAALLATYDTSERELMTSFDELATYQKNKMI